MTNRISVPTFLGGISQQTHGQRQPNLVDDALNIEFLATEGATKRYPTEHVARISTSDLAGSKLITLERDDQDYAVLLSTDAVRVFDLDGTAMTVNAPGGFGYLSGASETDFRWQNIADSTVVLNRSQVVSGGPGSTKASWVEPGEATLFVRAGNFGEKYSVTIKLASMAAPEIIDFTVSAEPGFQQGGAFQDNSLPHINENLTAGQAAGTDPIGVSFNFQSASSCNFRINGSFAPASDFRAEPRLQRFFYEGTAAAGSQVEIHPFEHNFQFFIQTDNILRSIIDRIERRIPNIDFEFEQNGAVARLSSSSAFEVFEVNDSQSGTIFQGYRNEIAQFSDLPLVGKHGQHVRVTGLTADTADDFVVRFATTEWAEETQRDFDLFDTFEGFGAGTWIETEAPGLATGTLDASTMPHLLRRISPTVFEWAPIDWIARDAGDDDSNPEPSFVGENIRDVFFHQNRIGFLAQNSVILSESAEQFNFWRTSVLSLPDSDPIDVEVSDLDGDVLNHATPFNDRLIVFSKVAQASIFGDPTLSPSSISAPVISSYRSFANVDPVRSGQSLFFGYSSGQFAQFREYIPTDEQDQFVDAVITTAAPKLVPSDVRKLTKASVDQQLAVLVESDRRAIFLYQFFRQAGNLLQAAWTRWEMSGDIVDIGYLQDRMVLIIEREGETFLETMQLGIGRTEDNNELIPRLDRRAIRTGVYDRDSDTTSFAVPYDFADDAPMRLAAAEGTLFPFGAEFIPSSQNGTARFLFVNGDVGGQPMYLGENYTSFLELSRPYAKQRGDVGETQILGASTTVRKLHVAVTNTGYLRAEVEFVGSEGAVEEFLVDRLDVGNLDAGSVREGEMDIAIHANVEEFRVRLINDTAAPSTITSGAWDIRLNVKYRLG